MINNIVLLIVMSEGSVHVKVYALTTCGWCKKAKNLLNEMGIEYEVVDVDLLQGEERETVREEVRKYNPSVSFPTIVIDGGRETILGFKPDRIKELLG